MVGHDKPASIPLFRLCLQTRKLSLDGFVNQRPLFFCVIFHLHIIIGKRTGSIRIFSDIITRWREYKHTSIETLLSLFLKSWSSPSCFFCSSVSTSDSCGTCGTSGTSYHKENTTVKHKSTLQHWTNYISNGCFWSIPQPFHSYAVLFQMPMTCATTSENILDFKNNNYDTIWYTLLCN